MKKIIISSFTVAVLLIACAPKTAPTGTSALLPAASAVSASQADIDAGHTIFSTNCTKCHGEKAKYVTNHSYNQAIPVLTSMSKKAKLTPDQISQLAAYVNSVAKK
jgi:mono/diheme cytochrome c family protein